MQLPDNRRGAFDKILAAICAATGGVLEETYLQLSRRGINSRGGTITLKNGRVWTGDPVRPWADGITARNGWIVRMDADRPEGRVIDLDGRLAIPGFSDDHCHPEVPFILLSPEAPMLQKCASPAEVLTVVRRYVEDHPEDRYPRLFGWMTSLFRTGWRPTRQELDSVVADRPCFLSAESGHEFWANTLALREAGVLEADPSDLPSTGVIHRDPVMGLATGHLEETEFAATDGVLLRSVRRLNPLSVPSQVLVLRFILDEYSKVGVTHIWQKDGDPGISAIYQALLARDALPVRAYLDSLYCPLSTMDAFERFAEYDAELRASGLPTGFLRADGVKLMVDLLADTHQAWLSEPYADEYEGRVGPVFPLEELREQVRTADLLGLTSNFLAIGDQGIHESLNLIEWVARINPPRNRRYLVEHAEYVRDEDLPRFRSLDAIPVMNPIGSFPDCAYQAKLAGIVGRTRIEQFYQSWARLLDAGACVVGASDFPLAPMDPLVGMHLMVNGTDLDGNPTGGLWPHKNISVEQALRAYTVNPAYATREEDWRGSLRPGHVADVAVLSEDILSPAFDMARLPWVKTSITVLNGHAVFEDLSDDPKVIDFGS